MRLLALFVLIMQALFASCDILDSLKKNGIPAKVSIVVRDDSEMPIANADVKFVFCFYTNEKPFVIRGKTDNRGCCSALGKTNDRIVIHVSKDGYYKSWYEYHVWNGSTGYETGRWEPWNPTIDIPLYKTKNPDKTDSIFLGVDHLRPKQKYGVDLLNKRIISDVDSCDIVDLYIETLGSLYDNDINFNGPWQSVTKFSFLNSGDGIIEMKRNKMSDFSYTYMAPIDGYSQSVTYKYRCIDSKRETIKGFPSISFDYLIFRISRMTTDGTHRYYYGIIDSWNVSKNWVSGDIGISILYRINQEPSDRNIEYYQ